ncbi:hypothetical protein KCU65_g7125, partial [Aureobasidium melanogenum]
MPSDKKRKTEEELRPSDEPQAVSNSTMSTPMHVFIIFSLVVDPSIDESEQEILGIYTSCETANSAAHDYYNKKWKKVSMPEHLEPEDEDLRSGAYRFMEDYEEADEGSRTPLSNVRLRHDGGLRFGGREEEDNIIIVWVQRRELNPSTIL